MKLMKNVFPILTLTILTAMAWATPAGAAVPSTMSYQGKLVVGNTNYLGTAYFKFAVVNATDTVTYWSNDGTSSNGQIPNTAVELTVVGGLFNVALGDTRLVNMIPLPASAFASGDAKLRVWFSTQPNSGFQLLSPDQPLRPVPYAHTAVIAETVLPGAIGNAHLQPNSVTEPKLANEAVSTRTLASGAVTGGKIAASTIDGSKIAAGSVAEGHIIDGAVSNSKLRDGSVTANKIAAGSVSGSHIADRSITSNDLAYDAGSIEPVSGGNITLQSGNMGVGVPSPQAKCHINGDLALGVDINGRWITSIGRLHIQSDEFLYLNPRRGGSVIVGGGGGPGHFWVTGDALVNGNVTCRSLTQTSDRNTKTNIAELNHRESLDTVLKLPLYSWSFTNAPKERHEGPMSQDWHKLTGLGPDDKHVNPADVAGKALSAIKGLHELVQEKDTRIASLERQLDDLLKQMAQVRDVVAALANNSLTPAPQQANFRPAATP